MTEELRDCPFCGGTDLRQGTDETWVRCKCRAEGPGASDGSQKRGRELWNTRAPVKVKPGQLERIVWSAMAWARENPSPDEVPEYTDGGNSFAETECRAAVRLIREALE